MLTRLEELNEDITAVAGHSSFAIVAAAIKEGSVTLYEEDMTVLQTLASRKDVKVEHLSWHPSRKILLLAWLNGIQRARLFRLGGIMVSRNRFEFARGECTFLFNYLY